ncbi:TPA: hypothetical protein I9071_003088 [Clostridium perfringens]|nr:hypothetical protein [Clostridium perfringens]
MKIDINKIYGLYRTPEYGTGCNREKIINELKEKIQDKDDELNYLCEVIDALEEEKEELNSECEELEEENTKLKEELIKVKRENIEFKMEKIAKEMKTTINPKIIKAGLTSMKNCLDAIDLLSNKGDI